MQCSKAIGSQSTILLYDDKHIDIYLTAINARQHIYYTRGMSNQPS